MKLQLIPLDTPIIVSDGEIKEGELFYHFNSNRIIPYVDKIMFLSHNQKIIAGLPELPSIDFNGFEEQLGIVDVEKLSIEHCKPDYDKFGGELEYVERQYWIKGFKAAQKLNEKKFSLKDMAKLWQFIVDGAKQLMLSGITEVSSFDDYIKSLQQPKVFDIEVEMEEAEEYDIVYGHKDKFPRPLITNNRIKITKML